MATVADILTDPRLNASVVKALRQMRESDSLCDENLGEDRLMFCGFSWEGYLALDNALGHDRASPRLYFLDGMVEIMSTSQKHEELKKWIADMVAQYFIATHIKAYPRGQATLMMLKEAGAEPDESWTFGERKEIPDLVLEIALTSGGLPKLEIYQRFGVQEVWVWRKGRLEVWSLNDGGTRYSGPSAASKLLPSAPITLIEACALIEDWTDAITTFRDKLGAH